MVIKDNFNTSTLSPGGVFNERRRFTRWRVPLADPLSRWAALVIDFIVQAPIIGLVLSSVKKQVVISEWLGKGLDYQVYIIIYIMLATLLVILYQGLFTAFFGGTPGKLFFGLRVISNWNEERPSVGSSFERAIYWCLGAFAFFLPHLAIFYHRERRPIYDRLADTVVIAQEKYAVGPPENGFSGFLKFVLSIFYVTIFAFLSQSLFEFFQSHRNNQSAKLFWQDEEDSCHAISSHMNFRNRNDPDARIESALSLYAIGLIDDECLDREADSVLWNHEGSSAAYAAKAMLFVDEKSIFTKYLQKTCEAKSDKDYCLLIRAIKRDNFGNINPAEKDKIYFNLSKSKKKDIKLWALKHWLLEHEYAHALDLMNQLSSDDMISNYLTLTRAKILWATGQTETARAVFNTYLPTVSGAQKMDTSAWLCYQESLDGCSEQASRACNVLKKEAAAYANNYLDAEYLVPMIRNAECESNSEKAINLLAGETTNPRHLQLMNATQKLKFSPKEAKILLEDIVRGQDSDELTRVDAMYRLLEMKDAVNSLDLITTNWRSRKLSLHEDWPLVGKKIFNSHFSHGHYEQAYEVGQLISRIDTSPAFLEKWIVSSYHSGHEKRAQELLSALEANRSRRLPASNGENAFESVRQNLKRKNKP